MWGCDPTRGVSFRVGPGLVGDELRDRVASCWGPSGSGFPTTASSTSAQGREFAESLRLQCEQLVELVLTQR